MKKNIYLFAIAILFSAQHLFADAVFLKDGGIKEGRIISEDAKTVVIETGTGGRENIPAEKITRTVYGTEYRDTKYIYVISGGFIKGHIVGETRDSILVREALEKNREQVIPRGSINFISKHEIPAGKEQARTKTRVIILEFDSAPTTDNPRPGYSLALMLESKINETGNFLLKGDTITKDILAKQKLNRDTVDFYSRLGNIYSVDAVITGTVEEKNGVTLLTTKSMRCSTGMEIASAEVIISYNTEYSTKLEECAYLLSGFTKDQYRETAFEKALELWQIGIGMGTGWTFINNLEKGPSFILNSLLYTKYFETNLMLHTGSVNCIGNLNMIYPHKNIGFGTGINFSKSSDSREEFKHTQALIGFGWRPTADFRLAVFTGFTFSGSIKEEKSLSGGGGEEQKEYIIHFSDYDPLYSSWIVSAEYRLTRSFSLKGMFFVNADTASLPDDEVSSTWPKTTSSRNVSAALLATYGFEF